MATNDHIKALIRSHIDRDDERFLALALQVAAHSARQGHGRVAEDIKTLVDEARKKTAARLGRPVAVATPKGELAGLLAVSVPRTRVNDMVLDAGIRDQLERVLREQRASDKLFAHGLVPARKLLLVGPPGSGKTMSAAALAGELGLPLYVIVLDGTGLKCLVLGQDKAWDGYVQVFPRDELTVFLFDLTKHADRLAELVQGFIGTLLCDAESRNGTVATEERPLAFCNAHPRRKMRDAERAQPDLAAQGGRFFQAMYELEAQARGDGLTGEALLAFRRRRIGRVLRRFRTWLDAVVARDLPPSDPVRRAAKYYINHYAELTRFLDDPAILPLDNNASEREFQHHAKLRLQRLFAGSPEGAHRWVTLLGVVRTAQKHGLDVLAYLTWMFERRGTHRREYDLHAADLTPAAYLAGLRANAALAA